MNKYKSVSSQIIAELVEIVGARNVMTDQEKIEPYSHDEVTETRYHHLPEVVVLPQTAEEVAAIMKLANRELIPVVPRGAGTGLACGAVPIHGGIVLSLERMNKILEINTDSLYMVVEPGMRTDDVQKAAKEQGLFYAGDPCSGDSCFIGGNVATNAGGNKAVKYGTTRQQVYGMEVVTPLGEIINLGGRLAKNTTGYCLEQLMIGSEGTLGIVTQITLKLMPLPRYVTDLLAVFPDVDSAIAIVNKIIKAGVTPTCVEFMDNITIKSVESFLNEKLPASDQGNYIIIQVEADSEDALDDKSILLDELCNQNGALSVLVADPVKIWRARKAFAEAVRHESLIMDKEDIVVPVDQIPEMMSEITKLSQKHSLAARVASHAGDGNIHLNILKGRMPDAEWDSKIEAMQHDLYKIVYRLGGKLSGEHGIGYKRKQLMQEYTSPVELNMMRAIKKALDPNLILNPGKIFDVI
ncbi:FAD-binding oxidoreductase [Acetonema longum]|uniref:FAD linked oxidase domain-containing protein n=1 Tax=Acetonema longum DSM 6540 TaxID=1009370 RepID=F7NIH6_9FIRM|nr:FAD-binding oxidoreductase [Acetonema longum]EGO64122.1 FAD linked oxidase domain-containing protein [Acetonema longum DSM 6540]